MRIVLALMIALAGTLPASADYALGLVAFDRGELVAAEREFVPLAEAGHAAAQYSLAMLYLKSDPPAYGRAIPWLEKSARAGLPDSQYMLGMLTLYGVGTAKNAEQGMRWLTLASEQENDDARALLQELELARLREAETARRKAEQARNLQAELEKAMAAEQALKKRLAQSKQQAQRLEAERRNLKKARATDTQVKEDMRREQARLEAALETLRRQLARAEAERARAAPALVKAEAAAVEPARLEPVVEEAPGEAVVAGKVVEILPDGVLLTDVSRRVKGHSEPFPEGFVVFLNLAATEGLSEGQEVAYPAEPATPYRYKYESGATGRIRAFRAIGN